ncbi:MAG: DUF835 domain-containing protein [Theionarchaea archaeon]|nr:DUF835 domain-containing protein [Theionarchaea archaeon]
MHRTGLYSLLVHGSQWKIVFLLIMAAVVTRSFLWILPLCFSSLLGFKFSLSENMNAPPDARCGALCSLCLSYRNGRCSSCAFGPRELRTSCPIFLCAEEKQTWCTECPEMLHCKTYRDYVNRCPFEAPEVLEDTLPHGGFLVKESMLNHGLNLFIDRVVRGDLGLIIMRQPLEVLAGLPLLKRVPIVQLKQTVTHGSSLDPTNLAKLHLTIQEFFEAAPRATILLEGMEYLIVHNGVDRMLKFIQSVAECARVSSSRFITIIDPRILDGEELVLLERELTLVSE